MVLTQAFEGLEFADFKLILCPDFSAQRALASTAQPKNDTENLHEIMQTKTPKVGASIELVSHRWRGTGLTGRDAGGQRKLLVFRGDL